MLLVSGACFSVVTGAANRRAYSVSSKSPRWRRRRQRHLFFFSGATTTTDTEVSVSCVPFLCLQTLVLVMRLLCRPIGGDTIPSGWWVGGAHLVKVVDLRFYWAAKASTKAIDAASTIAFTSQPLHQITEIAPSLSSLRSPSWLSDSAADVSGTTATAAHADLRMQQQPWPLQSLRPCRWVVSWNEKM